MKLKELLHMSILLALLIVCSQIIIPIGVVPITLQTFAIILIGIILRPSKAGFVTLTYLCIGVLGLPVFSRFNGGIHTILSPTFGFIISFIPASMYISSYFSRIHSKINYYSIKSIMTLIVAHIIIYFIGATFFTLYMNYVQDQSYSLLTCLSMVMFPFIPGDLFKIFLALLVAKHIIPIIHKHHLS